MKLTNLNEVQRLQRELGHAEATLHAFEEMPGDTVPVMAVSGSPDLSMHGFTVELLPVPKAVAVSAAERIRAKVMAKLQALGVDLT